MKTLKPLERLIKLMTCTYEKDFKNMKQIIALNRAVFSATEMNNFDSKGSVEHWTCVLTALS